MFNLEKLVYIKTNTSNRAIRACLIQDYKGKRHPIAYYLYKIILVEQNYNIFNKELLTIITTL